MKIKSINIIYGKNKWSESKDKLIHMVLDLGVYENKPSDKIEGFYERIKEYLPSLQSHRCSEGKPGGFFKRIKDGTWMGHIIEHVALELQTLAGMNTGWGRTRGVKGQKGVYNVVFNYENEDSGKLAAREAFNVVNDIINDIDPKIDRIVKKLKPKNLQESIRRIIKEELRSNLTFLRRVPMDKLEKSFGYALKEAEKKYYKYLPVLKDDYKLHFFTREVIILLLDSISHLMYPTTTKSWYDETFSDVKEYFKDRIKERWETL